MKITKYALLVALLALFYSPPAWSQAAGNLSAASTDCGTTNSCIVTAIPPNVGGATLKLSGTFTSTNQFEASASPSNTPLASRIWVALLATPSDSSTAVSSATSAGAWQVNVSGYTWVRIRTSAYTSGAAVAAINLSTASARGGSGGGGGGGGTVTGTGAADQIAIWSAPTVLTGSAALTYPSGVLINTGINSTFGTPVASMSAYAQSVSQFGLDAGLKVGFAATNQNGLAVLYDGTTNGTSPGEALNAFAVCHITMVTSTACDAINGQTYITGNSTLSKAYGISSYMQMDGMGTITDVYGLWAQTGSKSAGTVTRNTGVQIDNQSGFGTTNYGLHIADQGAGANDYAIYSEGGKSRLDILQVATSASVAGQAVSTTWDGCGSRGLGDGLNAIAAGTYLQFACVNDSGKTITLTGIRCWTDNAGTSTLNAANNAATALLTGAVTCNATKASGGAAGTQSATVTLASGDAISFTFVADGTSKQTNWSVSGHF